jgi:hypothetical protein
MVIRLVSILICLCLVGRADASSALATASLNISYGNSFPIDSAMLKMALIRPEPFDISEWHVGPVDESDIGATFVADEFSADDYVQLDWNELVQSLTSGVSSYLLSLSMTPPGHSNYTGVFLFEVFSGFSSSQYSAAAHVPSLNGLDFAGYAMDRFELTLDSLAFRHDETFNWIDASFHVQLFGTLVPEPPSSGLLVCGLLFISIRSRRVCEVPPR